MLPALSVLIVVLLLAGAWGDDGLPCGPVLVCQNGGICRTGNVTAAAPRHPSLPAALPPPDGGFYCECDNATQVGSTFAFTGQSCDIPYVQCSLPDDNGDNDPASESSVCYHGGTCFEAANNEPTSANSTICNCENAVYNGIRYSGRHCEQPLQDVCSDPSFCLNGGTCQAPNASSNAHYCICQQGFTGRHCEHVLEDDLDCDLSCENGGMCQVAAPGYQAPWGTRRGNLYCECPDGFAGVQCEHTAEICGNHEKVCLHGTKCQPRAGGDNGSGFDCTCPYGPGEYRGGVCVKHDGSHFGVTRCSPKTEGAFEFAHGMAVPAFCANGGVCRDELVDGLLLSGCDCPAAFTGPHCEFVRSAMEDSPVSPPLPPDDSPTIENDSHRVARIMLVTFLLVGSLWWPARLGFYRYRAWKRSQEGVVLNLQSFREENQGAVSANGAMLFPSMQQQPVGDGLFTLDELMHDVEIS